MVEITAARDQRRNSHPAIEPCGGPLYASRCETVANSTSVVAVCSRAASSGHRTFVQMSPLVVVPPWRQATLQELMHPTALPALSWCEQRSRLQRLVSTRLMCREFGMASQEPIVARFEWRRPFSPRRDLWTSAISSAGRMRRSVGDERGRLSHAYSRAVTRERDALRHS